MNKEILDNYKEHELHNEYDRQCSTCFSERYDKATQCGLAYTGDLDTNGLPEFIGTQDQWEAFDILLESDKYDDEEENMFGVDLEMCYNSYH